MLLKCNTNWQIYAFQIYAVTLSYTPHYQPIILTAVNKELASGNELIDLIAQSYMNPHRVMQQHDMGYAAPHGGFSVTRSLPIKEPSLVREHFFPLAPGYALAAAMLAQVHIDPCRQIGPGVRTDMHRQHQTCSPRLFKMYHLTHYSLGTMQHNALCILYVMKHI